MILRNALEETLEIQGQPHGLSPKLIINGQKFSLQSKEQVRDMIEILQLSL